MMKSQMSLLVMREENVNICIYISWDMKNEEHHEHTTLVFLRKCGPRFVDCERRKFQCKYIYLRVRVRGRYFFA